MPANVWLKNLYQMFNLLTIFEIKIRDYFNDFGYFIWFQTEIVGITRPMIGKRLTIKKSERWLIWDVMSCYMTKTNAWPKAQSFNAMNSSCDELILPETVDTIKTFCNRLYFLCDFLRHKIVWFDFLFKLVLNYMFSGYSLHSLNSNYS